MYNGFCIPIEKIIGVACKNFLCFSGLHTFHLKDGVNTIIGSNGSGKSSFIKMILEAFSVETSRNIGSSWFPYNREQHSLIEIKFIHDGEEHYLRRVLKGDDTTDLHLYIGNGENRDFLRDGEVISYLKKFPCRNMVSYMSKIGQFDIGSYQRALDFWKGAREENSAVTSVVEKILFDLENGILKKTNGANKFSFIPEIKKHDLFPLLGSEDGALLLTICMIMACINESNNLRSNVILLDNFERGLSKQSVRKINSFLDAISEQLGCQFIITSHYRKERKNVIKLPRYIPAPSLNYRSSKHTLQTKIKSNFVFKSPPYFKWR